MAGDWTHHFPGAEPWWFVAFAQLGIDWRGKQPGCQTPSPRCLRNCFRPNHNCHDSNILKIGMMINYINHTVLLDPFWMMISIGISRNQENIQGCDSCAPPQAFHEQGGELVCGAIVSVRRGTHVRTEVLFTHIFWYSFGPIFCIYFPQRLNEASYGDTCRVVPHS